MTARKALAKPVANLADAKKAQAAMRQAEAGARQRHPAGSQRPAAKRPAPAKKATATEAQKVTYQAVGRGGVTRTQQSASPLVAAVDVCIAGRKAGHFAKGAVIAFYATEAAATQAANEINGGAAGKDWTDAKVVKVTVASAKAALLVAFGGLALAVGTLGVGIARWVRATGSGKN
jgi:hypothetical protein